MTMTARKLPCPRPDLLAAFDEGVLPAELAHTVERHLESCNICRILRRDLRAPNFSEPSEAALSRVETSVFAGGAGRKKSLVRILAGVAAGLVLGIGMWQVVRETPVPQQVSAVRPSIEPGEAPAAVAFKLALAKPPLRLPLQDSVIFRGEDENPREAYLQELGEALVPYRADRFAEAAARLEGLSQRYPAAAEPLFYRGVSLLMAGDVPAGRESLLQVERIQNDVLGDDIAWYLAIAHERSGAWDSAQPLLAGLCRSEGRHKAAACAALEEK